MNRWSVIILLILLPTIFAHTASDPNTSEHDHPLEADPNSMCTPADPVDDTNVWISGGAIFLGALSLAIGVITRSRRRKLLRYTLLFGGALLLLGGIVWASLFLELNAQTMHFGWPGQAHIHADFQMMINNQLVDFTNDYYFSYLGHERSRYVHLHDPDYVVHSHADGTTWQYFWQTLNVSMNDTCLTVRGTPICNATYVRNGMVVPNLLSEPIEEGDRVLFHVGDGDALAYFPQVVGNNSCLHSGTCPERGVVPGCSILP